ncbi:serine/threonine-protein kinase N2-like [Pelobates fuscus]|uniref:serine/threonine-protein kinase N2-like n=1 Tax=Pelobates fuscus TaxID=191477 RepID=UPI002FE47F91
MICYSWSGSVPAFEEFVKALNDNNINLKLTHVIDEHELVFLDLKILLQQDGTIQTELFRKATSTNSLLHWDSHHPYKLKASIPYGRAWRNCSVDQTFYDECKILRSRFKELGYPNRVLKRAFQRVSGTQVIDVIEQGAGAHPDGPQIPVASDSDSFSSPDEDKLATFEKQLEDEYKVKSEAEKLIKAYSTDRSKDQKHLSDAQKILHDSKRKIEILRMLILQHKETPTISPLEKRIEELSHRFAIERAVAEGAEHATQKLDGKPLVEAQSILQASNEKLDLLKYSLQERVKELPDGHHRKSITTEELSLGSVKSKSIALTGTLKVRVKGCHGILENVPGRLKDPSDVLPGRSPRRGRFLLMNRIRRNNRGSNQNIQETFDFSKYRRLDSFDESKPLELCVKLIDEPLYCEVRTQLKIDHIPVGSTSWKTVSNPSWNKTFKLDLDKSRELEISLYWHDQRSLCATKTLKLEEFLLNPKQELCLQLEPQGTLFIKVTFSSPFTQKRPKLQTIKKLISSKQEETTEPAPLEDAAIDAHSLPESDTESVDSSAPAVDTETEKTIQPAPEEDVVTDNPILPVATESMRPLTPDADTITEETFQPPPVEATTIDNVPVVDTENVDSTLPAINTISEETIQPPPVEARISDNAPLPVKDTDSVEPSVPAVDEITEKTIQPAPEEDAAINPQSLPVEDSESMKPLLPADDEDTEKTIQPPPEEDAAINPQSLPVEDSESMKPLLPADDEDTEKIIQPAPEQAVVIDTPQVSAVDNKKVESSPPGAATDMEKNIQTSTEKDAVIDIDNIAEETTGPPKGLVRDAVPLAEADVENPSSSAGIQQEARLSIQDFDCLCVLGRGAFGKVGYGVNSTFNIKGVKINARLICEKEILQTVSEVQHPFLVNMLASFQTQGHFCFLMEYAAGGDLMTDIRNNNFQPFSTTRAVFYAACCVLGLDFLHQNDIVHRDLKLENIVIDIDGFAKITDFGLSKQGMGYGEQDRTYCGTLHYMAPEMVCGKPYTTSIDWWSLGAVIYIMLCGMLLHKDPKVRLGASENDAWDLKSHPFFKQIDWFALLFKSVRPPCVPSIEGPDDVRYFNRMYTSCAPILTPPGESESLSDVELELFKDFDWVSDRI